MVELLSNSESAALKTSVFQVSFKMQQLDFLDPICLKRVFWGRNIRKHLSNLESAPEKTPLFRVSFKMKHYAVSGPNLTKKRYLWDGISENDCRNQKQHA